MEGLFVRTTPAFVCAPPERRAEELTLEAVWPEDGGGGAPDPLPPPA